MDIQATKIELVKQLLNVKKEIEKDAKTYDADEVKDFVLNRKLETLNFEH